MSEFELTPAPAPSDESESKTATASTEADNVPAVNEISEAVELAGPPLNSAYVPEVAEALAEAAEEAADDTEPHFKEVEFSFVTHSDPARQADPNGIYLDDIVRREAEIVRARIEGREPDLKSPGSTAGDVVQHTSVVQQNAISGVTVKPDFTQEIVVGVPNRDANGEFEKSYHGVSSSSE